LGFNQFSGASQVRQGQQKVSSKEKLWKMTEWDSLTGQMVYSLPNRQCHNTEEESIEVFSVCDKNNSSSNSNADADDNKDNNNNRNNTENKS